MSTEPAAGQVRKFAEGLKNNGVNVILDQWHIRLGSDITIFMERNLEESDRVLVVCTEEYLEKAKRLKGGVGYERMIVTSEIASDLNTSKFIPVLKEGGTELLPPYFATRKYIDFRVAALFDEKFKELLHELHDVPRFPEPPLGNKPFSSNSTLTVGGGVIDRGEAQRYHWHRAVHEYCGNSLYFVFLRFSKDSIFFRESILRDLQSSGIADYMIFHLYSHWDILIRAWADRETYDALRNQLEKSADLRERLFLTVSDLIHIRSDYKAPEHVIRYLTSTPVEWLEDMQRKWASSQYFSSAYENGLVLEDSIRFDNSRIQFYITVKRDRQLSTHMIERLRDFLQSKSYVENKSIYRTAGSFIVALIKGQIKPVDYYSAYTFLQEIAEHLKGEEVETETMFVAQPEPRASSDIEFERAKVAIGSRIFKERFPQAKQLRLLEQRKLEGSFLEIWDKLGVDTFNVFESLFEVRIEGLNERMAEQISFFSIFEKLLRDCLPSVVMRLYRTHD